ncbi:MAG: hypothetical protein CVV27_10240 [Candidatus Melainabacteria bacterium HGW-Melainabacteria-1]|nr:MAG: hypothetical protein CVV27_10240 [Candidatus Melainabacteria bacterium HGW-Melainabacteria-1]
MTKQVNKYHENFDGASWDIGVENASLATRGAAGGVIKPLGQSKVWQQDPLRVCSLVIRCKQTQAAGFCW